MLPKRLISDKKCSSKNRKLECYINQFFTPRSLKDPIKLQVCNEAALNSYLVILKSDHDNFKKKRKGNSWIWHRGGD